MIGGLLIGGVKPLFGYWYSCPTGGTVTCPTSCMCSAHGQSVPHRGVDITASPAPMIGAAYGGQVTFANWRTGYGLTVEIKHWRSPTEPLRIEEGGGVEDYSVSQAVERWTRYAHLAEGTIVVEVGQYVSGNQDIGRMGNTGGNWGIHLHWEVRNTPVPSPTGWFHIQLSRGQSVFRG